MIENPVGPSHKTRLPLRNYKLTFETVGVKAGFDERPSPFREGAELKLIKCYAIVLLLYKYVFEISLTVVKIGDPTR